MLKTLNIENFTCFPQANLEFSRGLNVIVGENGTGKSQLLKLGYAILRTIARADLSSAKEPFAREFATALVDVFNADGLGRLPSRVHGHSLCHIKVVLQGKRRSRAEWGSFACKFSPRNTDLVSIEDLNLVREIAPPLFIPPKEILSIYPGFQHALENRELHFDDTYLDLAKALSARPLRGPRLAEIAQYLNPLEAMIGGTIKLENNAFYFYGNNNQPKAVRQRLEAPLMAEGHRKLGMLMYLLQTGGLRELSSLFWDEPEANLNPRLIKKLAVILVELSQIMQITITTHSLFLLRELEILQENKKLEKARYFGLHLTDNGVEVLQGDSSDDIGDLAVLDASIAQSEEYMNLQYTR